MIVVVRVKAWRFQEQMFLTMISLTKLAVFIVSISEYRHGSSLVKGTGGVLCSKKERKRRPKESGSFENHF